MKKHGDVYVVHQRNDTSMGKMQTVFLGITRGSTKPYQVLNGRHFEMLGRKGQDINATAGQCFIPARIDCIKLESLQDEWIPGGELIWDTDAETVECENIESDNLLEWLNYHEWDTSEVIEKLSTAMTALAVLLTRQGPFYICWNVLRTVGNLPSHELVVLSEFEVLRDQRLELASEGFDTETEARRELQRRRADLCDP